MQTVRVEKDSMGEMQVPAEALWGAQTQRAVENFPISGYRFGREFIRALGRIKAAAACVNEELGLLPPKLAEAIRQSGESVAQGEYDDHFVLDVFQTGSGTSTNMNANEVIASLANEKLGGVRGGRHPVHPNDHVNLGQSSNDVIPTALHLSLQAAWQNQLLPTLGQMEDILKTKEHEFAGILKIGRTHLQDATPVKFSQIIQGWNTQVKEARQRLQGAVDGLASLAIGGTAVGTGINSHPEFATRLTAILAEEDGFPWREAEDHFAAQSAKDAVLAFSAALRGLAVSLSKIAEDIRLLASGPRCGIGELILPPVQPGSSIMPGKVNPVLPEALLQVCAWVIAQDQAVTLGNLSSRFELNVMMPLMTHSLLESIRLLSNGLRIFGERCLQGLQADGRRCAELLEQSLALVTPLATRIGYDAAAAIAKTASEEGIRVREAVREAGILSDAEIEDVLDPWKMV